MKCTRKIASNLEPTPTRLTQPTKVGHKNELFNATYRYKSQFWILFTFPSSLRRRHLHLYFSGYYCRAFRTVPTARTTRRNTESRQSNRWRWLIRLPSSRPRYGWRGEFSIMESTIHFWAVDSSLYYSSRRAGQSAPTEWQWEYPEDLGICFSTREEH